MLVLTENRLMLIKEKKEILFQVIPRKKQPQILNPAKSAISFKQSGNAVSAMKFA